MYRDGTMVANGLAKDNLAVFLKMRANVNRSYSDEIEIDNLFSEL
jgi:hypothetical protein